MVWYLFLSRSSAVVLSLLVVTHAHVLREKRQLSLNGQPKNNPNEQFQTSETPQRSKYQLPLPPQPKPQVNVQLPPGVSYNIQTNVQATPLHSLKQQYEPSFQTTAQQERNHPQYQPPILPQQFNAQPQFSFHPQSQQHQNLQQNPLGHTFQPPNPQQGGNQQVIYINGQPVVINAPKDRGPVTPTSQQQSGSQGVSFSTSHSTEVIRQGKIGSAQPSVQSVIQKAPASEIEFNKGPTVKDKDGKQDEYVIYYYYYYDDDANKTNPTLNFDDIPNLETYDQSQRDKAQKSSERASIPQNVINNAFKDNNDFSGSQTVSQISGQDGVSTEVLKSGAVSSVSVSVPKDSPISNIYRYGNNVPRFPISPNLVDHQNGGHSEISNKGILNDRKSDSKTLVNSSGGSESTPLSTSALFVNKESSQEKKFEHNNEVIEAKTESETTEAITTTTEATTTTEEPTTTTERNQRRTFGSRGRFGTRRRRPGAFNIRPRRPKSTTTTTISESTTDEETSTRGFQPRTRGRQRNRFRSSFRRNRFRNSNVDKEETGDEKKEITTTESSTYGTTRRRFGSSRLYGNSRNSGRPSSEDNEELSTSKPTRTPSSFLSRRRKLSRPRLSFLRGGRNRFGHHNEEKEEEEEQEEEKTTSTSTPVTDAPETTVVTSAPTEAPEEKEDEEPVDVVDQETTTTESSRFAGLFRRRKRPSIFGNRPSFLNRSG
ncbi:uncharacterized protein LOC106471722 [Limulus polyphemus]|uniref:Uncharacterized protein LOC106471722 n=1 Tax=Limulus polyphemus TaxID=6850 RepID=A0ABM1BSH2_LIMPO|nr:uncharacterized protein LOC106471722 [Limulus polyphemus]